MAEDGAVLGPDGTFFPKVDRFHLFEGNRFPAGCIDRSVGSDQETFLSLAPEKGVGGVAQEHDGFRRNPQGGAIALHRVVQTLGHGLGAQIIVGIPAQAGFVSLHEISQSDRAGNGALQGLPLRPCFRAFLTLPGSGGRMVPVHGLRVIEPFGILPGAP